LHLKSLTLKGFKSFADRTRIVVEPGVTTIVGPNGSGKSNIIDAILWVLGEQSAKTLRGQSMEDVIFAGSSARKSVGVSEVDLVLDNSDGILPLEFAEVTITRRMFRSGESEYLINHSPARLMDIHDLLSDSGLGRDTHSIISQGRLDEILNSRPDERRVLIEEAAGIRKHKKRKERALRKLQSMDGHVDAVRHIIREINRQLRPLERQADRARKHGDIADELKQLELALAVESLRGLRAEWDSLELREKEQDSEIELHRYRLSEKEEDLERFQKLLEEKGLFVGDLGEQRRRLQSILERLNSGLLLLEEKGKHLIERLSELRAKVHHSDTRLAKRRDESEGLNAERASLDAELEITYAKLGELRREAEAIKKHRLNAEEELEAATGAVVRTRKKLDDLHAEESCLKTRLTTSTLEGEMLSERRRESESSQGGLSSTLSARRSRREHLDRAVERTRKELLLAEADVDKRVRLVEARRKELDEARGYLQTHRAEIRALEEIDHAFKAASPALAWALSKQSEFPGILGSIADSIHPDPDIETVLEHALGSDLFAIAVTDDSQAVGLLRSVMAGDGGTISVLPADAMMSSTPRLTGDRLMDRVVCDDIVRPIAEALLGDIVISPDLDSAVRSARTDRDHRYATSDGHMVWPNGKISFGATVDTTSGVLARKRRINELRDNVEASTAQVGEFEASVSEAEDALSAAQQDALDLGQRLATQSGELESLAEDIGRIEETLTASASEMERINARLAELEEQSVRDEPDESRLQGEIAEVTSRLATLGKAVTARRTERDARYRDEAAISAKLGECQVDIATVSEREVHLKRRMAVIAADVTELEDTLTSSRSAEEALEMRRERIHPVHELYAALLEEAVSWAHKLGDRARFEQTDSESLRETIHDAQTAVRDIQTEIDTQTSTLSTLHVDKGQLEVRVAQAAAHIVEGLGVPLETALDVPPLGDTEIAEEEAHRLRKRLSNLGPVNPIAVEEYEALLERRSYLDSQLEDLLESKRSLQKVVSAIDRRMRDRFLDTFEQVDEHFQNVFGILFPGGNAGLVLTDPDDAADTGVEVVAQPRGKKLRRMSLMSGGEKSLVALALLFALYHTRPCPFHVLDEVEAALDDINLKRFIGLIDVLRSQTQFVIVTHQRRTMEMSDLLYGVSMQADGVSKVVSQRLERTAREEASSDEHAMV